MKITETVFKTMLLSSLLMASQLQAADPINPEVQPLGAIGPIELSNTDISGGDVKAYRGWFENGAWQGDLIEYDVSSTGGLTTSIDLTSYQPAQSAGGTNWSAHVQFAAKAADWWDTSRKIITLDSSGNQIPFRWSSLDGDQRHKLDAVAANNSDDPADDDASSPILDYLRGDRSNEKPNGMLLRQRLTVLGDIVHSNPEYVGAPEESFTDSSYIAFKNANLSRDPRVYVGANDGMLHAFDADTGDEVWAYVPSMLIPKMVRLVGTPYFHRYFVDGGITVRDAKLGVNWKTILVGSLGAGGKGLYALDVTSPSLAAETTAGKVLGELSASDATYGDDIGYIFDATTITQLNDGKWYAVNGNGISSTNGLAKLLLIRLEDGAVISISTGTGSPTAPNGLAAPALVDLDNDGKADVAYAGDIDGDMWKFDLRSTSPAAWDVDYLVYDGTAAQPITLAPDITNHPQFGQLVLFGTGKLYEPLDVTDTTTQAIYGIWDKGSATTANLLLQNLSGDISGSFTGTTLDGSGNPVTATYTEEVRTFNPVVTLNYATYNGWYINLPAGERLLTPPALRAGRLKTTVSNPDGFTNWFLEATFDEGSASEAPIFDLNRDGALAVEDRVFGNADTDLVDPEDIPMAWKRPDGNMSQVTIARLAQGEDTLFLNFLNPPLIEEPVPCTGICDGGLEGGHMDVDTDTVVGGATAEHDHNYDNKYNVTYVDYIDIGAGQVPVTATVDGDVEFVLLVANADWSPGGTLTIGNVEYNVVEYQAMIHKALRDWRPGHPTKGNLEDPDGNPLIHTLNGIQAAGGTLRMSFNADALIGGGLVPNKTGCVKSFVDPDFTAGRWRGNALTTHLVRADELKNLAVGQQPLDKLRVQAYDKDGNELGGLFERIVITDGTQILLKEDKTGNGINGLSPEYEIYGGLTAKEDDHAMFLWETTVFWHWKEGDQPDICWSDTAAYREEYVKFTGRVPMAFFEEKLFEAFGLSTFDELVQYIETLEPCQFTTCQAEWERAQELYEMGQMATQGLYSDSGGYFEEGFEDGGGGGLTGTPQIIPGGIAEGGLTSGPNFETGRRTWTDILPQ